ncbi:MAG: YkgJ family cysteine cluster protein [Desulfatitalea sp.]|nr:YkgJ family cysteine cluster protein [Desulfatitalea sp.]
MTIELNRSYFFDAGLRFECRQCGTCCSGAPGTIYVAPHEIDPIAARLGLPVPEVIKRFMYPCKDGWSIHEDAHGHCRFFASGCTIYSVRPHQCRAFPFWFRHLRSESRWHRITRQCPGIGQGRCYTHEQILTLARSTMGL